MSLAVLAPGLATTVQDGGRRGFRAIGVGEGGAADRYSLAVANLLAGNAPDDAVLEIALTGPTLRLGRAATIAVCGATIDAHVDGLRIPGWRPVALPAGSVLALGACRRGARAYLAFDGGIDVPVVLGGRGTDVRGGFGGFEGRALQAGDRLELGRATVPDRPATEPAFPGWWIGADDDLDFGDVVVVRVLPGADATDPPVTLFDRDFTVDAASNRQGLRLRGDALRPADPRERVSEPVVPGTVQLPPGGQPIVLLADAQTVGGYPRIAHVIAADLPRLAQRRAGQRLRFAPADPIDAARAAAGQQARLARIALAIASRRR